MSNSVIKLLPDHIANQIAAGEVIQRPASVVKELVENAIDAGATKIDIIIKDAGRTLIQINDNGKGMSAMDAVMCFERHATSKLNDANDLFNLTTKGFRGEALASISAISHVRLKTCLLNEDIGTAIEIEGSQIKSNDETVCSKGTSLEVKNLFFNVPARRNFLKSDQVEFKHIIQEFERIAMPHSEVELKLIHNGETLFHLAPANLRKRIVDLNSKSYNDKLVPIDESTEIVRITGFVVKPEASKKSRGEQYFFVNNRYFKDSYFHNAVNKAFDNLLQSGTFPGYYLFLEVDPDKIDVNVHPAKIEIKFEEERLIYSILLTSIKNSLGKFNIMPTLDFESEMGFDVPTEIRRGDPKEPQIQVNNSYNPFNTTTNNSRPAVKYQKSDAISSAGFNQIGANEQEDWNSFYTIKQEEQQEEKELDLEFVPNDKTNYLISGNFLITNTKGGVLTIHFRRAYERIIYDEMMADFISRPIPSQGLLFPYEIEIDGKHKLLWVENEKMLHQLGLQWKFDNDLLLIESIPSIMHEENLPFFLQEMTEQLNYSEINKGEIAHRVILSMSRSAAMQKNLVTEEEIAHDLVERLFVCEDHIYSPTGKTILKKITFEQIEKL
jgi:DNA mismatch repair protein MutL